MDFIEIFTTNVIEIIFSLVTTFMLWAIRNLRQKMKLQEIRDKATIEMVKSIARRGFLRDCKEYLARKSISVWERDLLEEDFKNYTNIKGNGTVAKMVEEVLELPIETGNM